MSKEPPELVEPAALLLQTIETGFGNGHSLVLPGRTSCLRSVDRGRAGPAE
jgi:hypothetical protein